MFLLGYGIFRCIGELFPRTRCSYWLFIRWMVNHGDSIITAYGCFWTNIAVVAGGTLNMQAYLELLRHVRDHGTHKGDRTLARGL